MRRIVIVATIIAAACSPRVIYKDRIVEVSVPVTQPCATERPAPVPTLKQAYPDWSTMDVRQKAAAVGKQAMDLRGYGERLDAATGGCE